MRKIKVGVPLDTNNWWKVSWGVQKKRGSAQQNWITIIPTKNWVGQWVLLASSSLEES
jgi:hypothetical protein